MTARLSTASRAKTHKYQHHVPVPANSAAHLVFIQPYLLLGGPEDALDAPARAGHPYQGLEGTGALLRRVDEVSLPVGQIRAEALEEKVPPPTRHPPVRPVPGTASRTGGEPCSNLEANVSQSPFGKNLEHLGSVPGVAQPTRVRSPVPPARTTAPAPSPIPRVAVSNGRSCTLSNTVMELFCGGKHIGYNAFTVLSPVAGHEGVEHCDARTLRHNAYPRHSPGR